MLDEVKKFYSKTRLRRVVEAEEADPPITHTEVFHKTYPRFSSIKLSDAQTEGELEELFLKRISCRSFSNDPLPLDDLSKVLLSARIVDKEREPERRTYPSAGARFPIEIYVINFNISNLPKGVHHYNILDEAVELLLEDDLRIIEKEIVSPYLDNASAAIVFTSVIPRAEVKYGIKAYPYSLIEAGHIAQNMQLTCAKYDIGCCSVGGFVNETIVSVLDLTEHEIPIYVLGLGKPK